MSSMKGVNKAIATAKKVAKQSVKVTAVALPALTIIQNALECHQNNPSDPAKALQGFIQRFTGVTQEGKFSSTEAMKGTGRLLIAAAAAWAVGQVT